MKAIIDNKIYDTDSSKLIFEFRKSFSYNHFLLNVEMHGMEEVKIYKSKKNNYFFCYDDKDWPKRRRIEAVDLEEVKRIISNRDPDKYIELFGTVDLEEA